MNFLTKENHIVNNPQLFLEHLKSRESKSVRNVSIKVLTLSNVISGDIEYWNKNVYTILQVNNNSLWVRTDEYNKLMVCANLIDFTLVKDISIGYIHGLVSPFPEGPFYSQHQGDYYEVHLTLKYD